MSAEQPIVFLEWSTAVCARREYSTWKTAYAPKAFPPPASPPRYCFATRSPLYAYITPRRDCLNIVCASRPPGQARRKPRCFVRPHPVSALFCPTLTTVDCLLLHRAVLVSSSCPVFPVPVAGVVSGGMPCLKAARGKSRVCCVSAVQGRGKSQRKGWTGGRRWVLVDGSPCCWCTQRTQLHNVKFFGRGDLFNADSESCS